MLFFYGSLIVGIEMSLFHTMGFAGSVAIIIYILSYVYTKRHLPIVWHKVYLTVTIVLFLIPFLYELWCMGEKRT